MKKFIKIIRDLKYQTEQGNRCALCFDKEGINFIPFITYFDDEESISDFNNCFPLIK